MSNYILNLLDNGLWIFPVRGKGKTIEEAKQPLAFCKIGDKYYECSELIKRTDREVVKRYRKMAEQEKKSLCKCVSEDYYFGQHITWKHEEILKISRIYAKRGHNAWALWLWKSNLFGIDIDLYKSELPNKEEIFRELKEALKGNPGFYVEASARGGIHVITGIIDDTLLKLNSSEKWIEHKHDGYFIIYPTCLETPQGKYCYKKVGGSLIYPGTLDITLDLLSGILTRILGKEVILEVIESKQANLKIETGLKLEGLKLDVDNLTNDQITALLYLLFMEANCEGMEKAMEWIAEHGIVPVKKRMYSVMRIPRTTRWLFQYSIASVMAYLGFSSGRIYDYLMSWRFIDEEEDPRSDSPNNVLYNIFHYGIMDLMPKGGCPWCWLLAKKESCGATPLRMILRLPREKIIKILEFVKLNIKPS